MANYYMLGGDGKEYGPVTSEQLRQWAAEGRANTQTQVRDANGGAWAPLGSVPELSTPAGLAAGNPALASVLAQTSGTPAGSSPDQIKRLAAVLSSGSGWMKFLAVLLFIYAGFAILGTFGIGLIFAWIPIWFGVILWGAASRANAAYVTGGEAELTEALDKLRFFFKLYGIFFIIGLVIGVLFFILVLAGAVSGFHGLPRGGSFGP